MMEEQFSAEKGAKTNENTTNYGEMLLTKRIWASKYLFPGALSADITEILRVSPNPKIAGHNIYISFNFAKNSTRAVAEAALGPNFKWTEPRFYFPIPQTELDTNKALK